MNKADNILEKILDGGLYLLLWGAALVIALVVFVFVAVVAGTLSSSFTVGIVGGLIVTFVLGVILYQIGKHEDVF